MQNPTTAENKPQNNYDNSNNKCVTNADNMSGMMLNVRQPYLGLPWPKGSALKCKLFIWEEILGNIGREVEEVRKEVKKGLTRATMGNQSLTPLGNLWGQWRKHPSELPHSRAEGAGIQTRQLLGWRLLPGVVNSPARPTCGKRGQSGRRQPEQVLRQRDAETAVRTWGHILGNGKGCGAMGEAPRASAPQTLTHFILQKPFEVGTFPLFPERT